MVLYTLEIVLNKNLNENIKNYYKKFNNKTLHYIEVMTPESYQLYYLLNSITIDTMIECKMTENITNQPRPFFIIPVIESNPDNHIVFLNQTHLIKTADSQNTILVKFKYSYQNNLMYRIFYSIANINIRKMTLTNFLMNIRTELDMMSRYYNLSVRTKIYSIHSNDFSKFHVLVRDLDKK